VRVENPITWFRDEFRRENLEARERRAARNSKLLAHPVRYAAGMTVFYGSLMWLALGRDTDVAGLVILAVASLFYGLSMLWWARRWNRKFRTVKTQGAASGS
jgi:hypothetical protein